SGPLRPYCHLQPEVHLQSSYASRPPQRLPTWIHHLRWSPAKFATSSPERIQDQVVRHYLTRPGVPSGSPTRVHFRASRIPEEHQPILVTTQVQDGRTSVQTWQRNVPPGLECLRLVRAKAAATTGRHSNERTSPAEICHLLLPFQDHD